MRIIFFGSSDFSVPILKTLAEKGVVFGVVSTPARPVGRGQSTLAHTPVAQLAQELHLPLWEAEDLNEKEFLHALNAVGADIFLVAAYGKILPENVLKIPTAGSINIHGSLLPRHRGASPIQAALLEGDAETGITFILMDAKIDHGPILARKRVRITKNDSFSTLSKRLAEVAASSALETMQDFLEGRTTPLPQQDNEATYVGPISKEDGHIDFSADAEAIERRLRAFEIWPGVYAFWQHENETLRIKIIKARAVIDHEEGLFPGTVWRKNSKQILVQCGKGALELEVIQPEGQKEMDVASFINGRPEFLRSMLI